MLSNGAPPHLRNGSAASNGMSRDVPFRHMSTGSLNIPNGPGPQNGASNGQPQVMGSIVPGQRLESPRSPPGKQSESCSRFQALRRWLYANWRHWQTHRMSRVNSSDRALARLARPVLSVTIWRARQTMSANTLPRFVTISVALPTANHDVGKL